MSYIGNTPGVSSQRVVLEEVVSGSPKSAFVPQSGYILGYVDVLINGHELDTSDFTAPDGVNINLVIPAAVGDTVKVKTWLPRGLSDGYLKTEADARYVALAGSVSTSDQRVAALKRFMSRYSASDDTYAGAFAWNSLQLGNNGDNFIVAGKTVAGGSLKVYVNNTNEASGSSGYVPNGTFAMEFENNGRVGLPVGQLKFPATQNPSSDANTLDDYEEGTWTPTILGGTTNPTITSNASSASYTKVGNLVTLNFYLQGARSGGSGDFVLSGLPFPIAVQNNFNGGALIGYNCAFTGLQCIWRARSTTQLGVLGSANNASGWSFQLVTTLDTGTFALTGSVSYQAT